jgi:hypothetical protein
VIYPLFVLDQGKIQGRSYLSIGCVDKTDMIIFILMVSIFNEIK